MEEQKNFRHPDECKCSPCDEKTSSKWCCSGRSMGCMHRSFFLRLILAAVILSFVFSMGVKLGELKSYLKGSDGYGYRQSRFMMNPYTGQYPRMMQWYEQTAQPQAQSGVPVQQ
ncbi:MAG: hypothetical protein Q7S36_03810 [Candidatus Liptonbacteria bacterium]|nr:hypothetical protein [Candidatus Liptonbacteria bacterium]